MYERAVRAYRRWTRLVAVSLGSSPDRPRRQRVVLTDTSVTVLTAATLARIAAEDAAEAGAHSHG